MTFQITNTGAIFHSFDVQSIEPERRGWLQRGRILLGGESETQTITFTKTGAFMYQCDQHYSSGMVGTLTVTQLSDYNRGVIEEFRSNGGKVGGRSRAPTCSC